MLCFSAHAQTYGLRTDPPYVVLITDGRVSDPIWTNFVFVSTNGNDGTAVRNNSQLPALTLSNAVALAQGGDLIVMGDGEYDQAWQPNTLPANVSIRGIGRVIITYSASLVTNGVAIVPGDNSIIDGLYSNPTILDSQYQGFIGTRCIAGGVQQARFTNATVRNCYALGGSDSFYVFHSNNITPPITWTLDRCGVESDYDGAALLTTNTQTLVRDSVFITHGPPGVSAFSPQTGINNYGTLTVIGGSIKVSGSVISNHGVKNNASTATATICGTMFDVSGTAATNWGGGTVTVCTATTNSPGYYFPPHTFVSFPNTNRVGELWNDGTGFTDWVGGQGALAPTAITFPASTVNWTNTTGRRIELYIDNTGVTGTALKKNGTTVLAGVILGYTLILSPGDYFSQTYSAGTPTAAYNKF